MLDARAFANAVTAVSAAAYVVCRLLSVLIPDLLFGLEPTGVLFATQIAIDELELELNGADGQPPIGVGMMLP